jgi:hypothetical protein
MRLATFLANRGIPLRRYGKGTGCYLILADELPTPSDRAQLYRLQDYYVSSAVSGPGYVVCVRIRELEPFFTGKDA